MITLTMIRLMLNKRPFVSVYSRLPGINFTEIRLVSNKRPFVSVYFRLTMITLTMIRLMLNKRPFVSVYSHFSEITSVGSILQRSNQCETNDRLFSMIPFNVDMLIQPLESN